MAITKSLKKKVGTKEWRSSKKKLIKGKLRSSKKVLSENGKKVKESSKKKNTIHKLKQKKYNRGKSINSNEIVGKLEQKKIVKREKKIQFSVNQSVNAEVLLTEDIGYLVPEEGEVSSQFNQKNIKKAVDPLSASKGFDLNLKFGPYRMNYTRNGRFLLLGGRKGHVAALDWVQKKLLCEINVMEAVYDVSWLHQETMFAVAQKKWVYIYDSQGTEIHCIKQMHNASRLLFLPYHFILASVNTKGFINWLDVSIGKLVGSFPTKSCRTASAVALHPANGLIGIGEPNGVVSFWGPNSNKPAIQKWCHKQPICSVAFDPRGVNFVTAALDRQVKIWDARNLIGPVEYYQLKGAPRCIAMSHKDTMALGLGNMVEIYNNKVVQGITEKNIYLRHEVPKTIGNIEFCPFEDVLGIAHNGGFSSMLVPGCGEANFDALEVNPFQSKSQRREAEVKALLGKIPSELITWDTTELRKVNLPTREDIIEAKKQLTNIKAPDISVTPKKKAKKKTSVIDRKKIMKEEYRRNYVQEIKKLVDESTSKQESDEGKLTPLNSVLNRFKKKLKT